MKNTQSKNHAASSFYEHFLNWKSFQAARFSLRPSQNQSVPILLNSLAILALFKINNLSAQFPTIQYSAPTTQETQILFGEDEEENSEENTDENTEENTSIEALINPIDPDSEYPSSYIDPETITVPAVVDNGLAQPLGELNLAPMVSSPALTPINTSNFNFGSGSGSGVPLFITPPTPNTPPSATPDLFITNEDSVLTSNVLTNDLDPDGDSLTASLISSTSNGMLVFNPDGSFTYTPDPDFNGTDSFIYSVSDGNGGMDTATATIIVSAVNDPPVLDFIGDQSIDELSLLSFTATGSDVDGDTLSFSLSGQPPGASIDSVTGEFNWTPDESQGPGTYIFDVIVSDGIDTDSETITVTVNEVNTAPVLGAIGNQTIDEETLLSFTATATDADDPANTLTFSLAGAVPTGASIDANTGVFSWTPTEAQGPGTYTFDIIVSDGTATDTETITVTVNEVGNAPEIEIISLDSMVDENGPEVALTVSVTDADSSGSFGITIDWGDGTIENVNLILSFPSSEIFSFGHFYLDDPPSGTNQDNVDVSITITDPDSLTGNDQGSILVKNVAPALSNINLNNTIINENDTVTLSGNISDPSPLDSFALQIDWGDGNIENINLAAGTTSFSINHQYLDDNPTATPSDTYTINLVLTDDDTGSTSDSTSITVNNVAPDIQNLAVIDIPVNGTTTLSGLLVDPGTQDTFTGTIDWGDGSALQNITLPAGTTNFNFDHVYTTQDRFEIILTINDDDEGMDSETITVDVGAPFPPEIEIISLDSMVDENGPEVALTVSVTDADSSGSFGITIDWGDGTIENFTRILSFPSSEIFSFGHFYLDDPPSGTNQDNVNVSITITDPDSLTGNDQDSILVKNVAPDISGLNINPIQAGQTATLSGLLTDPGIEDTFTGTIDWGDGSAIQNITLPAAPTGMTNFSFDHVYSSNGNFDITIIINDDDLGSDTEMTNAIVTSNLPPVLDPIGNQTTHELSTLIFRTSATDPDIPSDTLTFSLAGTVPTGAMIDPVSGVFTWTLTTANSAGDYTFDIVVTDNGIPNLSDSETITVTVNELEVAEPPEIEIISLDSMIDEGAPEVALTVSITDLDSIGQFTITIDWGDGIIEIFTILQSFPNNEIFSFGHLYSDDQPTGTSQDNVTIIVTVTDDINLIDATTGNILIKNVAPTLSNINLDTATINENDTVTLSGNISDPSTLDSFTLQIDWGDGNIQTVNLAAGTTNFSVNHQYLDDNPTATPSDSYTINLVLTDDDTGTTSDSTSITVNNVAPDIQNLAVIDIPVNGTTTLSGLLVDPGSQDTFTGTIDWGDGSAIENITLPAGTTTFNFDHMYTTQDRFEIVLTINDDDGGMDSETITVDVGAPFPPEIVIDSLDAMIFEGETAALTIQVNDLDTSGFFNLAIDWGDGSPIQNVVVIDEGQLFSFGHTYLDDPPSGTSQDNLTVSLTVTDNTGLQGTTQQTILVKNVAPDITDLLINPIQAGQTATLSGLLTDPGTQDTFTGTIDWGDGSAIQNITLPAAPTGMTNFSFDHVYSSDGNFDITIIINDDDLGSDTEMTTIVVDPGANQPPIANDDPDTQQIALEINGMDTSQGYLFYSTQTGQRLGASVDFTGNGLLFGSLSTSSQDTAFLAFDGLAALQLADAEDLTVDGLIDVTLLNITDGLGVTIIDSSSASPQFGEVISNAGDINNDGINDFIVSKATDVANGNKAYVVFGTGGVYPDPIDVNNLLVGEGFEIIYDFDPNTFLGADVVGVGDINNDGIDDFAISDTSLNTNSGAVHILYGTSDFSLTTSYQIDSNFGLDVTEGVTINGFSNIEAGGMVSSGDINGDGITDIILSSGTTGTAGLAYVVFGSNSLAADVDLATLSGSNGFEIQFSRTGGTGIINVASGGDINGDSIDDFIVSNSRDNEIYVIFGGNSTINPGFDLAISSDGVFDIDTELNGLGFTITDTANSNNFFGFALAFSGDFNDDGFADLAIGSRQNSNTVHIVYGNQDLINNLSYDIGDLNLIPEFEGMVITATNSTGFNFGRFGSSLSFGDTSGDGIDDLLIGGQNSSIQGTIQSGVAALVFGHDTAYITPNDTLSANLAVLDNDSDPDLDPLTITMVDGQAISVGSPVTLALSGAIVNLNIDGTLTYDPNGQFNSLVENQLATDSFTYTISDGSLTDMATVNITIRGAYEIIEGDSGDNVLTATLASNILTGNLGADRFVFNDNDGKNIITDFTDAQNDVVDFSGISNFNNFTDIQNAITLGTSIVNNGSGGVDIIYTGGMITIDNSNTGQLDTDDFSF